MLFDEIKIKSGLVYSESTGCIVRFSELGNINEELNEFERKLQNSSTKSKELETYVICFMARGLLKVIQLSCCLLQFQRIYQRSVVLCYMESH